MVDGKNILLDNISRGKYGRLVADVYVDSRLVALEMVQNGFAWVYPISESRVLRDAEQTARENKTGLWSEKRRCPTLDVAWREIKAVSRRWRHRRRNWSNPKLKLGAISASVNAHDYILKKFFELDPQTIAQVIELYGREYGDGPKKYFKSTFEKWRAGEG